MSDFDRVAAAIHFLNQHAHEQPSLAQLAEHLGLSPFHLQRLFRQWAGVTPKQFLQLLTVQRAKALLDDQPVLAVSDSVGLSSGSRLHDHFVTLEAMTPGEVRGGGAGLLIDTAIHETLYGTALIAMTARGICALDFVDEADLDAVAAVQARWPAAEVRLNPARTGAVAEVLAGKGPERVWPLHVQGTNFQISVWRALLNTRSGQLTSYARLAAQTGRAGAARAVGQAVGANPVAVLIPCHRVIRETGVLGGYRWGLPRKQALLLRELGPVAAPD